MYNILLFIPIAIIVVTIKAIQALCNRQNRTSRVIPCSKIVIIKIIIFEHGINQRKVV